MATLEADVRDYLRGSAPLMALLQNEPARLNLEWKGAMTATHVTLYRSGGAMSDYLPHDNPAIALHCYGSTRPAAADLSDMVARVLRQMSQVDTPLLSASVESVNYLPTPDGVARYVVTALVTAQLAPVA